MGLSLADLRRVFYGGGSDAEMAFLQQASDDGLSAGDMYAGREIAYSEIIASFASVGGAALTDVPGLSITFTPGIRPIMLHFWAAAVETTGGAGTNPNVAITESDNDLLAAGLNSSAVAGYDLPANAWRRVSPPAGVEITYKVRVQSVGGGNPTVHAAAVYPAFLRAQEV